MAYPSWDPRAYQAPKGDRSYQENVRAYGKKARSKSGDSGSDDLMRRARARVRRGTAGAATYRRLGRKPPKPSSPKAAPPQAVTDAQLIAAAERLRFGDQATALQGQMNQNTRFTAGMGDWYANALNEIKGLQGQGRANSAAALQQVQGYGSAPAIQTPEAIQAAQARNALGAEFAAKFSANANSNSAAMDRLAGALQIQQGNTRNQANVDRQQLLGAQANLAGQRGAFRTEYGAQLQDSRAKAASEAAKQDLAAKALGLRVDTYNNVQLPLANSLMDDRKTDNRLAATNPSRKKTAQQVAFFNKHGYYPPTGDPAKKGNSGSNFKRTEGQKTKHKSIVTGIQNGVSEITRMKGLKKKGGGAYSEATIRRYLGEVHKLPPHVIDAAFEMYESNGTLSPATIKRLKDAGLLAPKKEWKRKRVGQRYGGVGRGADTI